MSIGIHVLDGLVVIAALWTARILGRRFFHVGLFLFIALFTVLGTVRLHYGLEFSWTFVGKIAVDFGVPLAMGWAGVHLAAEVKQETERKLWQAVFAILAIFGLGLGFVIESRIDDEHKHELNDLRGGIREDMTNAFVDYNKQHPEHPVTSDQFIRIIESVNEKHNVGDSAPAKIRMLSEFSNDELRAVEKDIAQLLRDRMFKFHAEDAKNENVIPGLPTQIMLARREQLKKDFMNDPINVKLFLDANYLQDVITTKLANENVRGCHFGEWVLRLTNFGPCIAQMDAFTAQLPK